MSNPQLGTDELVAAQSQPEVLVNATDRAITQAFGGEIEIDFPTDANYTLQATDPIDPDDEWAYGTIRMTDGSGILTAARDVIYPDVDTLYGGPSRLRFLFVNDTGQALTIKRSGQTGVSVPAGENRLVQHDGTDVVEVASAGGGGQTVAPIVTLAGDTYDESDLTVGAWHEFTSDTPVTLTVNDTTTDDAAEWGLMAEGAGGITIVASGVDIVPPRGGSLELEPDDFAMLKRRTPGVYKLLGETVEASQ